MKNIRHERQHSEWPTTVDNDDEDEMLTPHDDLSRVTPATQRLADGCRPRRRRRTRSQLRTNRMNGDDDITPVASARDLSIYLDSDVSMKTHVARTVSGCFGVLSQLRSISRSVSRPVLQSLVFALVLSRLDYGNATLAGIPDRLCDRLQSVMNAAARLIFAKRKHEHVTPLPKELHWL
jgi:hypothetical protein